MKQIVNVLLFCFSFCCSFFLYLNFTHALEFSNTHSGYYYEMNRSNGVDYASWKLDYYTINNEVAYCIETGVDEGEAMVEGNWSDTNLPEEIKERMLLLAYYGYNYPGHEDVRYRAATQALLWETILGPDSEVTYSTERYGNGNIYDVNNEKDKIQRLVEHHNDKPSFHGETVTVQIGKQISLEDTNHVLSDFNIDFHDSVDIEISGNTLNITPMEEGELTLTFTKKKNYSSSYKIFYGDTVQNMLVVGNVDEVTFEVKVKAISGKISLTKYDSETITAQGEATLEGAIYAIYRKSDDVILSYVYTDENGYAEASGFYYDEYYLKEIEKSEGYMLDETIYFVDFYNTTHAHIRVPEKVVKGQIHVLKLDSETNTCQSAGEATLEGAQYGIYDTDGNLVDTLTIGFNCMATSKELPYGTYEVRELQASKGYQLDETVYAVNIDSNEVKTVISKEKITKGMIKIIKKDKDLKECVRSGQGTLKGAEYEIYDVNGILMETLVIGEDCTALSKVLPYGHYIVRESRASMGYLLDTTTYFVFIEEEGTVEVVSLEPIIKNRVVFFKQIEQMEEAMIHYFPEKGVTFEIYDDTNNLYTSVITGEDGYATLDLSYGVWRVHQKNTKEGYDKIDDFTIYVDFSSREEQFYTLIDKQRLTYLHIYKIDAETKKKIALVGTTFKILNVDTGKYISQYIDNKTYDTFETDDTGELIIPLRLSIGNYKIMEIKSPLGYLVDKDGVSFSINHDFFETSVEEKSILTVYFENKPIKGQIIVHKRGETLQAKKGSFAFLDMPLKNVVFGIYAREPIVSSDGQSIYYGKDALVDTIVTQQDGSASSKFLPVGNYYLKEIKTNDDYVLDTTIYPFSIRQVDSITPIVYVYHTHKNQLKKGTLEFIKVDSINKQVLSDAEIQIFTKQEECIFIGKTDGEGKIIVDSLPVGEYYIVEIKAPFGYQLYMDKMPFVIQENGEVIHFIMENDKKMGTFEIQKKDSGGNCLEGVTFGIYNGKGELLIEAQTDVHGRITLQLPYGNYFYQELQGLPGFIIDRNRYPFQIENEELILRKVINQRGTSKITIHKVDQSYYPLEGVEIGIYTLDGILLSTGLTDLFGNISFLLENGKYYYQEKSTLHTYLLDNQKYYFEVNDEDEVFTLVNERVEVSVPNTFKNRNYLFEIIVFAFLFLVMGWKYAKN